MKTVVVILIFFSTIYAQTIQPVAATSLEFGGEQIAYATYTDGSRSNIDAGRGIRLVGGFDFIFFRELKNELILETTLGIKWTSTKAAKNGSIDWLRFPIEALVLYRLHDSPIRWGAGLTYHLNNSLKGSKDISALNVVFDNTVGVTLAVDYLLPSESHNISIGGRYTSISYASGLTGRLSGNSLGLNFNFYWP